MPPSIEVIDLCSDSDVSLDDFPTLDTKSNWASTDTAPTKKPAEAKAGPEPKQKPADTKARPEPKQQPADTKARPEPQQKPRPTPKQNDRLGRRPGASGASARAANASAPPGGAVSLLDKLNPAQRRAVTSGADTVAILAGPGSGKTHTLTSRVAWLIDMMGFAPSNVIVATFTVKAAREMKERIGRVLGGGREKRIVLGTFHSVSLRYLSAYGARIGLEKGFSIADDGDCKSILTRIIKRLDFSADMDAGMARGWISKKKAKGCLGLTGKEQEEALMKRGGRPRPMQSAQPGGGGAGPKNYLRRLEAVYDEYQQHLQSLNLLDFDDLLIRCTELLRAYPRCVANVEAVLIDEYQDTNGIQFELMKLLAQARNRITVVGDPDQSIYGWRSAEITNLSRFLADFPHTAEVALEANYRSSQSILSTSLQVIQQDQERYDKSLLPVHKKGSLPVLRRLYDTAHEARWIVQEIQRATQLTGHMVSHGDVAILLRSASVSRPIEQALARAAIPYRMIGGRKFFERAEIRILVDYLRVLHRPSHNDALVRIINVPKRGIGETTLKSCLEESEAGRTSFWTLLTKHCRGDFKFKAAINTPTEKKIQRFVGLMLRLRRHVGSPDGGAADNAADSGNGKADATADNAADGAAKDGKEEIGDSDGDSDIDDGKRAREPRPPPDELRDADKEASKDKSTPGARRKRAKTHDFALEPTKRYDLVELIEALIEQLDYRNFIGFTYGGGDEEARWNNVEEFVSLAREFLRNAQQLMADDELPAVAGVDQEKESDVLGKFLANIALAADAGKSDEEKAKPMVTISTIHAAKGLEWPVVFIPAAYDGSLPHSRSDDFNEERRLLYVAMTRAKCLLNVSYGLFNAAQRKGSDWEQSERPLSPFLAPVADLWFAERGPTFNRALLNEMGDILARRVPPDKDIYKGLPLNMPMEDDVLPLDPMEESRYKNDDEANSYEYGTRRRQPQQSSDRRGINGTSSAYTQRSGGGIGGGGAAAAVAGANAALAGRWTENGDGGWARTYATTMEGAASTFTMGGSGPSASTLAPQYSGFETAGSLRARLLVEETHAESGAPQSRDKENRHKEAAERGRQRRTTAAAPTGRRQQTIMQSFVRSATAGSSAPIQAAATTVKGEQPGCPSPPLPPAQPCGPSLSATNPALCPTMPAPTPLPMPGASFRRPPGMFMVPGERLAAAPAGIPPELKSRSLGGVRANMMSMAGRQRGGAPPDGSGRAYAHFSSSPPPPEPQAVLDASWGPAPQQALKQEAQPQPCGAGPLPRQQSGKENQPGPGVGGGSGLKTEMADGAVLATAPQAPRPAASFHTTTFAQARTLGSLGGNGTQNRKRPAGSMTGGCLAPMDRLRMPFKPPSIKRP